MGKPRSLVLRRTRDGDVKLVGGEWPDEHVFPFSWLGREIDSGLVDVTLTVNAADGPVKYRFQGFDPHLDQDGRPVKDKNGDVKLNFTAWKCKKVEG